MADFKRISLASTTSALVHSRRERIASLQLIAEPALSRFPREIRLLAEFQVN